MLKAAAGITVFNPNIDRLKQNIESISPQVEKVYIIDNHSENIDFIRPLSQISDNIVLVENQENYGIATALNQMCKLALKEGFKWILTLDQDSIAEPDLIEKYSEATDRTDVAIITAYIDDENEADIVKSSIKNRYETVHRCYTSASFMRLSVWREVGGFDERMFIDCVDFDYCTTVEEHGYIILRDNLAKIKHMLGVAKEVRFFMPIGRFLGIKKLKKPFYTYNHSPLRTYYYARNIRYYMFKHKDFINMFTERRVYLQWLVLKIGFEEDKIAKIKAILKAKKDAKKLIKELKNSKGESDLMREHKNVSERVSKFKLSGTVTYCEPYGNGHINDTYLVVMDKGEGVSKRYILQALNKTVFPHPEEVIENIERVTSFLKSKTDGTNGVLRLITARDGGNFIVDDEGEYWRMYNFVENSLCIDTPETPADFYESGFGFGNFQSKLCDFPAEVLHETIPDFHNTPKRYNDFLNAVNENASGRANTAEKEIEFVKARADFYSVLMDACKEGKLPLRVTHNDTKLNNVLLDDKTRKALCVIDLDTIMPGFSVTDFGDSIRFGASTAAEDEKDLDKVTLSMEMFKAYTDGFLKGCDGRLTDEEIMLLPEGAKMMTVECGMRFLADYVAGDTYFRTAYPEHNLVRCRTQFKLVEEMEAHWDEMKAIVKQYCKEK